MAYIFLFNEFAHTHVFGYITSVQIMNFTISKPTKKGKNLMSNFTFSFNKKQKSKKSAKQVFEDSLELVIHDNKLCISFNCVKDRKGYGSQFIPVDELEQVSAIFQDAKQNGIISESEQLSTSEILKKSLIVTDENEVRFKTEDSKGKKPTVCSSVEDFNEFVDTFVSYLPSIQKEVSVAKAEIKKQGIDLDNVK